MSGASAAASRWSFERSAARGLPPGASPRPALEYEIARMAREFAEARGAGASLFFINAHPRSGTNWLGALMNLHPQVVCTGEFTFHDVFNGVQSMVTQPGRAAAREPARGAAIRGFTNLVRSCMESLATSGGRAEAARVIGDHTPRRLRILVPDASYLVLFRDARDVVVSWTYNALARKEHWVVPTAARILFDHQLDRFASAALANDAAGQHQAAAAMLANEGWVRHVARQWASQVRDDLDGVSRLTSGELPGRVMTLRYEDLHADTEGVRAEVYHFLGVEARLARALGEAPNTLPGFGSRGGAERPEDPRSHYRRGQVGDWREKLTGAAAGWIEAEAGTELAFLGY